MATKRQSSNSSNGPSRIHLLDVGHDQYGDSLLCEVKGRTILIDGGHQADYAGASGHPSIPFQVADILSVKQGAAHVDLLVVSHAHNDHIGCLPEMVLNDKLTADYVLLVDPALAFDVKGTAKRKKSSGGSDALDGLVALLREEPRSDLTDRMSYAAAAADAQGLPQRYTDMIAKLEGSGKVFRHGTSDLAPLKTAFKDIGLKVLGPNDAQLKACRDMILGFHQDASRDFAPVASSDAGAFEVYQKIQERLADGTDAFKGPGPALNLQSSVLVFGDGTHKFLLTGDSQLEKPEVGGDAIKNGVAELLAAIAAEAPFDFVKLGHHGSYNAFGDTLLQAIGQGSVNFGICTGSGSLHHPSPAALDILKKNTARLTWVRTDRNGLSTFTFGAGQPDVEVTKNKLNDLSPPGGKDDPTTGAIPAAVTVAVPVGGTLPAVALTSEQMPTEINVQAFATSVAPTPIEIRIPYLPEIGVRVTLTMEVSPGGPVQSKSSAAVASNAKVGDMVLAGGRKLPPLLFITNESALARNVGTLFARQLLDQLRSQGHHVLSTLPNSGSDSTPCAAATTAYLRRISGAEGVVILGGLDVVPSQCRDALPAKLRQRLRFSDDEDDFIIWSDSVYGDVDGDGLGEIPVSRIPDGRSAKLLSACLTASSSAQTHVNGVRNSAREFAQRIYEKYFKNGPQEITSSGPVNARAKPYQIDGSRVYLMLHGSYTDATSFWGEDPNTNQFLEAVMLDTVAVPAGAIILTGACWGALTVRERARDWRPGIVLNPRTRADSLALRFLERGPLAYVGCTGEHYSPNEEPFAFYGGPLHDAFWGEVLQKGSSPAKALFNARKTYLGEIPHQNGGVTDEAIERKLYEQFTCLGLGW
jgi:beta-lactamase superfamily II metal-dependent hydrolase